MFNGPRNDAACDNEIETVEDYCARIFTTSVDMMAFRKQINTLIQERIADYIYQRYRDWPMPDLLRLEEALTRIIGKRADIDNRVETRGGRANKLKAQT